MRPSAVDEPGIVTIRSSARIVGGVATEVLLAVVAIVIGAAASRDHWQVVALVVWALLTCGCMAVVLRPFVRFHEESVEVRNVFRSHTARYQDITQILWPRPIGVTESVMRLVLVDGRRVRVAITGRNLAQVVLRANGTAGRVRAELGRHRPDLAP